MLYVTIKKTGLPLYDKAWHVGESLSISPTEMPFVESLQADCDELEHIVNLFMGADGNCTIPISKRRVNCWYGDIAKTIVFAVK